MWTAAEGRKGTLVSGGGREGRGREKLCRGRRRKRRMMGRWGYWGW